MKQTHRSVSHRSGTPKLGSPCSGAGRSRAHRGRDGDGGQEGRQNGHSDLDLEDFGHELSSQTQGLRPTDACIGDSADIITVVRQDHQLTKGAPTTHEYCAARNRARVVTCGPLGYQAACIFVDQARAVPKPKPCMEPDLVLYARRSSSFVLSACSWSGCSAGRRKQSVRSVISAGGGRFGRAAVPPLKAEGIAELLRHGLLIGQRQGTGNLDGLRGHIAGRSGSPLLTVACGDIGNGNLQCM